MARSARALVIDLVADVTDFVKGTQKADDALSDFVDSAERELSDLEDARPFKDFGTQTQRDLDGIERTVKDTTEDAERHFDNLAREARKSFRKIDDAADQELGGTRETFREAGAEAGSEFAQNLGEGISSGDFTGVATGTAGGLAASFAGLGPTGILLGIGVGVAGVIFDKFLKESKARAEQVATVVAAQLKPIRDQLEAAFAETTAGENLRTLFETIGEGDFGKGFDTIKDAANALNLSLPEIVAQLQAGKLSAEDVDKAFQGQLDKAKEVGGAVAPLVKAQNAIKDAISLQAEAAEQVVVQGTIYSSLLDPQLAKTQQLARNTGQMADSQHGAAGDARAMGDATAETREAMIQAGVATGITRDRTREAADAMRELARTSADADRNLANIARNSARTFENLQAAAGVSLGGRALRP